jgi:hypothetical protein
MCYHSVQNLLSSVSFLKTSGLKYTEQFYPLFGMVSDTKGRTWVESVLEQGAEENIWA